MLGWGGEARAGQSHSAPSHRCPQKKTFTENFGGRHQLGRGCVHPALALRVGSACSGKYKHARSWFSLGFTVTRGRMRGKKINQPNTYRLRSCVWECSPLLHPHASWCQGLAQQARGVCWGWRQSGARSTGHSDAPLTPEHARRCSACREPAAAFQRENPWEALGQPRCVQCLGSGTRSH